MAFKSGFVAVIGKPNVGKSSLVNKLVGEKVSIISPKAQTTRNRIFGLKNTKDYQIIFVDTPGISKPINRLGKVLNRKAMEQIDDVDCILFVVDGKKGIGPGDRYILEMLKKGRMSAGDIASNFDMTGATISYVSSHPEFVTNDGVYIEHEYDEEVTLKATINWEGRTHTFDIK